MVHKCYPWTSLYKTFATTHARINQLVAVVLPFIPHPRSPLRWRHNDHAGVSNHQPHGCLLNRLFRRKSKKTSKLRVTGLCAGNSPGTGEFPAQMASHAENVSIWWRHHAKTYHCTEVTVDQRRSDFQGLICWDTNLSISQIQYPRVPYIKRDKPCQHLIDDRVSKYAHINYMKILLIRALT